MAMIMVGDDNDFIRGLILGSMTAASFCRRSKSSQALQVFSSFHHHWTGTCCQKYINPFRLFADAICPGLNQYSHLIVRSQFVSVGISICQVSLTLVSFPLLELQIIVRGELGRAWWWLEFSVWEQALLRGWVWFLALILRWYARAHRKNSSLT